MKKTKDFFKKLTGINISKHKLIILLPTSIFFIVFAYWGIQRAAYEVGLIPDPIIIEKDGKYIIGEKTNSKIEIGAESPSSPFAKLERWGGEAYLKIGYSQNREKMVAVKNNGQVEWQGNSQNVQFYTISDTKKPENKNVFNSFFAFLNNHKESIKDYLPKTANAIESPKLRYVNIGSIDPISMASYYSVIQKTTSPTIFTYWGDRDSFVFYGFRDADQDLRANKVNMPITRLKTTDDNECPVIYSNKNGYVLFVLNDPKISKNQENAISRVEEAVNAALSKYNIQVKDAGHLLYFQDGLSFKQVGRISADNNTIIFYLYLDSPLNNPDFVNLSRTYIAFRDSKLVQIGGLKDLNNKISKSIAEEISYEIAKKDGTEIEKDNLTDIEKNEAERLRPQFSTKEWQYQAKINGEKVKQEAQGDKLEMNVVLNKKPNTNKFDFNIETKDLNFYYQPELTEEQKDQGYFRPENVIDSYAVYYSKKEDLVKTATDMDKYKNGKAFHIYRPKITDSKGNWTWGKLDFNKEEKILSVLVPQEFLDNAAYPVDVDPTIGYSPSVIGTSKFALYAGSSYYMAGSSFSLSEQGKFAAVTAYLDTSASQPGSFDYKMAIYRNSDWVKIAETQNTTGPVVQAAWLTANFSSNPTIDPGTYTLVVTGSVSSKAANDIYYDSGDTNQGHTQSIGATYGVFPSTASFTHDNNKYYIYATYTVPTIPSSTNFQLITHNVGAGGEQDLTSSSYKALGALGQIENGILTSASFKQGNGLVFNIKAPVPPAPSLTNPASNYDRLRLIINPGSNKSDATYAVAISNDNFVSDTRYIKSDFTIGNTLGISDFQSYTSWGGATGVFITNLNQSTAYYVKVKARQGNYTESGYGAVASASTVSPSLSFGLDTYSITFNTLTAANSYTDATKQTTLTTSTNAYNGYVVWANETSQLTSGTGSISNYSSPNSLPTAWSGTGFGYSTSDTNLQTGPGAADRFSGTKYAGFQTVPNQDPVADHTDKIEQTPLSNEQFTIQYRVTAPSTIDSGTYRNTVIYTVVPIY